MYPAINYFKNPPNKVCILRLSAIGDVCNVIPVVTSLKKYWPKTEITWVIGSVEYGLVKNLEDIKFQVVNKKDSYLVNYKLLSKHSYDLLINLHPSWRANICSLFIRSEIKLGFDKKRAKDFQTFFCNERIPYREGQHVVDSFLGFLTYLGFPSEAANWSILKESIPKFSDTFGATNINKKNIVISPFSGQRLRNYRDLDSSKYLDIAKQLSDLGFNIIFTGANSKAEQAFKSLIQETEGYAFNDLIGELSLIELMSLISCVDLVICPDSGPSHIANALGVNIITLFATSNPKRTGPYNYLHLAINHYEENLRCYNRKGIQDASWGERVRSAEAMNSIQASEVIAQVKKVLNESY